jgi:hypothetical protein
MKLDVSVAPELAMLAKDPGAAVPSPAGSAAYPGGPAAVVESAGTRQPATIGYLAACLRILVADPESWWDRVRFDPHQPVHVAVGAPSPGCEAWLLVLPPGYRADAQPSGYRTDAQPSGCRGHVQQPERPWQVACLVAGEVAEAVRTPSGWRSRPLSAGRTRVRGGQGPYRMINTGAGYAVSLHASPAPSPHSLQAQPHSLSAQAHPLPAEAHPLPAQTRAG